MTDQKEFKERHFVNSNKKEGDVLAKKGKNRTFWGVLGVILVVMGVTGTIPLALNKQYLGLSITAILVIVGIILIAWAFGD